MIDATSSLSADEADDSLEEQRPRAAGDKIGRYVLRRLLGEGSMGAVWVADDPLLAISVALKVLQPTSLGKVGVRRLLREARAAAQLKHPAIVHVLDFGVSPEGEAYLALELLEGETMTALVARGPVPAVTAVSMLLPVLDALAVAHEHGIVHRDIKPDNLFVARDERGRLQPKILDFGIAKSALPGSERLTLQGSMIGSPAYMAPEQVRGQSDIDGRADVWAVGATIYELLTGSLPFVGETVPHMLTAILESDLPSLERVPGVDAELTAILARAMAKSRDDRYAEAREMGEALARWLVGREILEDACGTSLRAAWLGAVSVRPPFVSHVETTNPRMSACVIETMEEREETIDAPADVRATYAPSAVPLAGVGGGRSGRSWWLAAVPAAVVGGLLVVGLARPTPEPVVAEALASRVVLALPAPIDEEATLDVGVSAVTPAATSSSSAKASPSPRASSAARPTRVPLGRRPWF